MSDNTIVEAKGKEKILPNNLNRKSPGKRPIPNFSNQGSSAEMTIKPTKITTTQRIITSPYLQPHLQP
jgi:hypothetical protein